MGDINLELTNLDIRRYMDSRWRKKYLSSDKREQRRYNDASSEEILCIVIDDYAEIIRKLVCNKLGPANLNEEMVKYLEQEKKEQSEIEAVFDARHEEYMKTKAVSTGKTVYKEPDGLGDTLEIKIL